MDSENNSSELRLIDMKEVSARTSLSRSSIYKALAAGGFPRPVHLTKRNIAWRSDEIEDWIRNRPRVGEG